MQVSSLPSIVQQIQNGYIWKNKIKEHMDAHDILAVLSPLNH